MSELKQIFTRFTDCLNRKSRTTVVEPFRQCPDMFNVVMRVAKLTGAIAAPPELRYRYVIMFSMSVFLVGVPKTAFGFRDVECLIIGMAELLLQVNCYVGTLLFFLQNDSMIELTRRIQQLSEDVYNEDCKPLVDRMLSSNQNWQRATKVYFYGLFLAGSIYCYSPVVFTMWSYTVGRNGNETVQFYMHLEQEFYGLDIRNNLGHYSVFATFMIMLASTSALVGGVKLTTIVNLAGVCTVHFDLITLRLNEQARNSSHGKEMKTLVKMHEEILDCVGLLEQVVSPVLLLQLVTCVLNWSLMLVFFSISGSLSSQQINLMVLFVFSTTETFGYCFIGDALSVASFQVAEAVYEANWENENAAVQADLQLIMVRAQKTVGITAGKFTYMNFESFGNVVQKTYSTFLVLKDIL